MKVLILGTAHPYRGGIAAFNERLAKQFQDEGHEVIIYTFTLQYPSFLFPGKTQYSSDEKPDKLNIKRKINSINPLNWIKIGLEIKKMAPDLVVMKYWIPSMAPCLGTISKIIRKNKFTKVISVLDNIIPHEKRLGDRILSSYFVKSVDGFVAMSKSVLNDVNVFDQDKPKILSPHPLYDNFGPSMSKAEAAKKLNLPEEDKYMLFFGFIRDYKGLDLLLKAFADKRFRDTNIKLIVAGEFYNNSESYFKLEKDLGLSGDVLWHNNFIPDNEVGYYFNLADIIVQPYITATQSGVTQIAYHFEKPMLVTNVGGLAEIVPNGKVGYVVEKDINEISEKLRDFFNNDRENEFKEGIKLEKAKYSWENMTKAVLDVAFKSQKEQHHDNKK